jgi:hypothetical protein
MKKEKKLASINISLSRRKSSYGKKLKRKLSKIFLD